MSAAFTDPDMLLVDVHTCIQARGSVWLFAATCEGHQVTCGMDWRQGQDVLDMLLSDGPVPVLLEDWQVLS